MTSPYAKQPNDQKFEAMQARIVDRLAELWQRQRPELAARVAVLDRAASAAADASLTPEMRAEAAALAHKLAGALGMFGHAQAGEAARKMELLLDGSVPLNGTDLQGCATELRRVIAP